MFESKALFNGHVIITDPNSGGSTILRQTLTPKSGDAVINSPFFISRHTPLITSGLLGILEPNTPHPPNNQRVSDKHILTVDGLNYAGTWVNFAAAVVATNQPYIGPKLNGNGVYFKSIVPISGGVYVEQTIQRVDDKARDFGVPEINVADIIAENPALVLIILSLIGNQYGETLAQEVGKSSNGLKAFPDHIPDLARLQTVGTKTPRELFKEHPELFNAIIAQAFVASYNPPSAYSFIENGY